MSAFKDYDRALARAAEKAKATQKPYVLTCEPNGRYGVQALSNYTKRRQDQITSGTARDDYLVTP